MPPVVGKRVRGDTNKPRPEGNPTPLEIPNVRERLMEDFGGHILRFRAIAKAARCVRVHEREVAFVKLGEEAWVFLSRLDQQTFPIHFVHSLQNDSPEYWLPIR